MRHFLAVLAMIVGALLVGVGASAYIHLRQAAASPGGGIGSQHLDVRIVTAGMADSGTIEAASYARTVQSRVFLALGVGVALFLIGGVTLLAAPLAEQPTDESPRTVPG